MEIVKTSKDLTAVELYQLTMAPGTQKMADAKTQEIEISAWCLYRDSVDGKEPKTILSVVTPEGETFATISKTFQEDFFKMLAFFAEQGSEVHAVKVIGGTSKAGRDYITCVYAK
jgi:hypothetical protein